MKSEWKLINLTELVVHKKGFAFKSKDYTSSGTPIVKVTNLTNDSVDMSDVVFVNSDISMANASVALSYGDIIITTVGSWATNPASVVGKTIKVPLEAEGALLNQNAVRLRAKDNSIDQQFLYYLLKDTKFSNYLVSNAQGSANQASITLNDIYTYEAYIPPLATQKKIAHILSTLDDKIELNRQMNQTLEKMAQVLFKSWFVDFDPVHARAKATNKAELTLAAKKLGISPEVLALFPDRFVESEMGMVPEGWSHESLSDYISVTKGKSYKSSELEESTTALVTLKSFLRGGGYRTDGIKPYTGKYKDEQVVQPNELIMAYTDVTQAADVIGKPAIVLKNESIDTLVASLDVGIIRVKSQAVNIMYLYQLFKTRKFQGYILGHTSGTTVLHLAKGWFDSYKILLPKQELMDAFNEIVQSLFNQMQLNIEQEKSLQKTRDALLPKLLSGEVEV